jgi:hypothetical protein
MENEPRATSHEIRFTKALAHLFRHPETHVSVALGDGNGRAGGSDWWCLRRSVGMGIISVERPP